MEKLKLVVLDTVIGVMNGKYQDKLCTFNVYYGNACLPTTYIDGSIVHLPEDKYIGVLKDFLANNPEYEVPSNTEVMNTMAEVVMNNNEGKYADWILEKYNGQTEPDSNDPETDDKLEKEPISLENIIDKEELLLISEENKKVIVDKIESLVNTVNELNAELIEIKKQNESTENYIQKGTATNVKIVQYMSTNRIILLITIVILLISCVANYGLASGLFFNLFK